MPRASLSSDDVVNQTVKVIAVARRLVGKSEDELIKVVSGCMDLRTIGDKRTGSRLIIEK